MPDDPRIFIHKAAPAFWYHYRRLRDEVRAIADQNFRLLEQDPRHPSLHFKKVGKAWSVRIGLRHRALAVEIEGGFLWFWIGSHEDYDRLLK